MKPEHFDIQENIYEYIETKRESEEKIEKYQSAVNVIVDNSADCPIALDNESFSKIQEEINTELLELIDYQTKLYDAQASITSNVYDLERQYELATNAANELEEDYKFSVESIPSDDLECPLCGTIHDNSLANRALLLSEKNALLDEANSIASKIHDLKSSLTELNKNTQFVTNEIERLNKKYIIDGNINQTDLITQVIDAISTENVSRNIKIKINNEDTKINKAKNSVLQLKKDQRKLISKEEKEQRLYKLNEIINKYAKEANDKLVGKVMKVLLENVSEKDESMLAGYTDTMKLVNVKADRKCIGKIVNVKITDAKTWSLDGKIDE